MDVCDSRNYLPSCWSDDARMNAMFTVFRSRDLNPSGWQEKMNFWVNSVTEFCRKTRTSSVTVSEVCAAFERDKKQPKCVAEVLDYMHREGFAMPSAEFESVDRSSSWLGWGYSIIKKPVAQSYAAVKSVLFESKREESIEERYVILDVVKDLADQVFAKQKELEKLGEIDGVAEVSDFANHVSEICKGKDLDFALTQLRKEKRAVICDEGERYVKFKSDDADDIDAMTTVDKAIVRLRKASDAVFVEINSLEREIEKCIAEAKDMVRSGSKTKAMMALRKKKRLESVLKKKTVAADNLETLLLQLKSCGAEKLVMDAYSAGVDAMKSSVNSELDLDKIDTVMSEIEGLVGDVTEIGATLSKSFTDDLSELEDELDDLMAEEQMVKDVKQPENERSAEDLHDELVRRLEALHVPSSDISPVKERPTPLSL